MMPAYSDVFPWPNSYGNYDYFERVVANHDKVLDVRKEADALYLIERTHGDIIRVFVCECYAFGLAQYLETVGKLNRIDVVLINSVWCGYTEDAKAHCIGERVGLFMLTEFMGALHQVNYWNYVPPER